MLFLWSFFTPHEESFTYKWVLLPVLHGNSFSSKISGYALIDILPSLSLMLGPKGPRKGIPTVFSPQGLTHLGGFLLLAT